MTEMSQLLFARPSFIEGVARAVDLGGTLVEYNRSATVEIADQVAIESDWIAVRQDLCNAIDVTNGQKAQKPQQAPESDR